MARSLNCATLVTRAKRSKYCDLLPRAIASVAWCHRVPASIVSYALSILASAGCGEGNEDALLLELRCASTPANATPELTVMARLSDRRGPLNAPAEVSLAVGNTPFTFRVLGQGLASFASSVEVGTSIEASASADQGSAHGRCTVVAGLSDVAPAARAVSDGAYVSWSPVDDAAVYRLSALDFASGEVLASAVTDRSPATLRYDTPAGHITVVDVLADALPSIDGPLPAVLPDPRRSHRQVLLTAGADGGSGANWQLFGPGDFQDGMLSIRYPTLASGEDVAVLLCNGSAADVGSSDVPAASVAVSGDEQPVIVIQQATSIGGPPSEEPRSLSDPPFDKHRAAAPLQRWSRSPGTIKPPPRLGERRALCVRDWSRDDVYLRIGATVQHRSANAAFWVDERAQPAFDAAIAGPLPELWQELEQAYEVRVLPALHDAFGRESDIDGDGVMSLLFTDLGEATEPGMVVGYFDPNDLVLPADTSADCSAADHRGANGLDLLYLRDLESYARVGGAYFTAERVVRERYPNVMAHELQHDINFNQRWLLAPTPANSVAEETWLNEALSQLAEDVAGYGLHESAERSRVRAYLSDYPAFSLSAWEGDAHGNYGGVHAFLRYFSDRFGPSLTRRLEDSRLAGKANFGAATGLPFELALAHFATASVVSNETYSPDSVFDYQGADWTPWHRAIGSPIYDTVTPSSPARVETIRADGWRALIASPGGGQPVSITIRTTAAPRLYVVAVRRGPPG